MYVAPLNMMSERHNYFEKVEIGKLLRNAALNPNLSNKKIEIG